MWDLGCVAGIIFFFIVAMAYTLGCEHLGMKETR